MYAPDYIWSKVLQTLEETLSPAQVSLIFRDVELLRLDHQALVLYTPTVAHRVWITDHLSRRIREILRDQFRLNPAISFREEPEPPLSCPGAEIHRSNLCPDYTLDNFLPGETNLLTLALARQAARAPGDLRHNPLVFYGPPGVGKTHLLHGIGNQILGDNPDTRVMYLHCGQFAADLVESIIRGRHRTFVDTILQSDVLLVDDVQFLGGKESVQQEFYLIFSLLYERGCQIVLTCSRPLGEVLTLEDRMHACFIGGIMHPVALPDRKTRLCFLAEYSRQQQLMLIPEALEFLAVHLPGGFPKLRGFLDHLRLQADALPWAPDLATVVKTAAKFRPTILT